MIRSTLFTLLVLVSQLPLRAAAPLLASQKNFLPKCFFVKTSTWNRKQNRLIEMSMLSTDSIGTAFQWCILCPP